MKTSKFFQKALLAVSVMTLVGTSLISSIAADRGNLVVFTANWCASCRELTPIVQDIASQNGLNVVQIDVDSQEAPKQARNIGVSMPGGEPPQIFYANRGHVTLLFNGRGYKFGSREAARATILQNLQKAQ